MEIMPLNEATKYKVVGTGAYDFGDMCVTGMPIYSKDDTFCMGYFGLSEREHFRSIQDPHLAKKYHQNLLLLSRPVEITKPATVESLCILKPLEDELVKLGVEEPFDIDYLLAKELLEVGNREIILRFGEMNEIADKLLAYSKLLQQEAIERMRNRQSIHIEGLENETLHTLLDASFSFHVFSHPRTPEGEGKKSELKSYTPILDVVYPKIMGNEKKIHELKVLFDPKEHRFVSSWEELERLADQKIEEWEL